MMYVVSLSSIVISDTVSQQDHLFEILKTKFVPGYTEFHSSLYICAPEFDFMRNVRQSTLLLERSWMFMSQEYFTLSETLLLPIAAVVIAGVLITVRSQWQMYTQMPYSN